MKIIVNQAGTACFTIGSNQFINISTVEVDGTNFYSVGVENISFGLFRTEDAAVSTFQDITRFLCGGEPRFDVPADGSDG